ncbi:MAG: hypothetical protein LBG83_02490 [Oscillospiraceae bacterium]|jgi:hypothetical protein|nr:hypothetical protein [Oscillospiraceae bacterium]
MKQTPVIILLCACLIAAALSSCKAPQKAEPGLPQSVATAANPAAEQAQGHYQVFLRLWQNESALRDDIQYLALNPEGCKLADTEPLIALLQRFCDDNGLKFLQGDFESLAARGFINKAELSWKDGVIVSFADRSLSAKRLVTEASMWRSGAGAVGIQYTATRSGGDWNVTREKMLWIS